MDLDEEEEKDICIIQTQTDKKIPKSRFEVIDYEENKELE